jgi:cytochrome c-type biogenesis protein CcmE
MSKKAVRVLLSTFVIGGALTMLLYTTVSEGAQYYKHVDEVSSNPQAWYGKKLQLHGYVVDKSIKRRPDSLDYQFDIQNNGKVIKASYTGVVPDTFKDGSEVVLKGHLDANGFAVEPDGVLAKCPSKYVADKPGQASQPTQ